MIGAAAKESTRLRFVTPAFADPSVQTSRVRLSISIDTDVRVRLISSRPPRIAGGSAPFNSFHLTEENKRLMAEKLDDPVPEDFRL